MTQSGATNAEIGARLKWARENAGLTQGQVAKMLGMHRPTISQIEAGDRTVKPQEISQFVELYDVEVNWILQGDASLPTDSDPRIALAARELTKLDPGDLDKIMRLLKVLRDRGGHERG